MSGIRSLETAVFRVPTDHTESDGTLSWSATTVVIATVSVGDVNGVGWTYGPAAAGVLIGELLEPVVVGADPLDIPGIHERMRRATRNAPTPGLSSLAISAVDVALWDLKAKLLGDPLWRLLGRARTRVPVYGSGGFVSETDAMLVESIERWKAVHVGAVKIKIGEDRGHNMVRDIARIERVRSLIGDDIGLMVDANGGYSPSQARRIGPILDAVGVVWFEEPVSSDDLESLALLRSYLGTDIAAGEYGTSPDYFRRMCQAGAVDCLQIDATRCGGYTGFLQAASVAYSFGLDVSCHCAPHLHLPVAAAIPNLRHVEFFDDHVRADSLLFEGCPPVEFGSMQADGTGSGHGISLKGVQADRYRVEV